MSKDLLSQLVEAEDELARTLPEADDALVGRVTAGAGRRRRVRHVRHAAGGLAAVAVVAFSAWAIAGPLSAPTPPATTPTVTTPPVPSPDPTTDAAPVDPEPDPEPEAPEPEVTGPPVREDVVDDATVLARLHQPRTGEVWTTPERAPELDAVLSHELMPMHAWRVGSRGDATIYILVNGQGADSGQYNPLDSVRVNGLYEVDDTGVRAITCPSARSSDPCFEPTTITAEVPQDTDTFYDTMTLPKQIELADGWLLTTTATTRRGWFAQQPLGEAEVLYGVGGREVEPVADLGAIDVVELVGEGQVPGLDDRRYALRLPIGTVLPLSADDSPSGQFANIRWDDGVVRDLPDGEFEQSTAPASGVCFAGTFSVEDEHVDAHWRPAGTTPGGNRVHVPTAANPTAKAVREWQADNSWTAGEDGYVEGPEAGYKYLTDEEFLADHALYAIQGPDGQWQLRLRADAVQVVYECA